MFRVFESFFCICSAGFVLFELGYLLWTVKQLYSQAQDLNRFWSIVRHFCVMFILLVHVYTFTVLVHRAIQLNQ